ncbi:Fur family transcriptional regulator, partial [Nonomuraea rubra]|uniref:Fur family transcriptional regulator n=1 Tax=Nonomuraea rubra TaxID=46180 RepID=UPI0035EEB1D9
MKDDFDDTLLGAGLRRTIPRLTILSILDKMNTHLSVLHLHRLVTDAYPMVNVSTVYRNVTTMSARGVLHSIEHGGETLFGLAISPHHHLICEVCGLLVEVPADGLDPAADLVMARCGFEMEPTGQLLRGRCRRCRQVSRDGVSCGTMVIARSMQVGALEDRRHGSVHPSRHALRLRGAG